MSVPGVQEVTARFDEMPGFSFTIEDILNYVPVMYMACIWACVLGILIDFGYYFIIAAVISWMAGVIASFMRVRLGNKRLFKKSKGKKLKIQD